MWSCAHLQRWLTLVTGLVECLCFAGAMFGWASLVFVLKDQGYFNNLCVNTTINGTQTHDCSGQDERFSLIFTIASFMNNFLLLPNGFLFDHFGTMFTRLLGTSVYTSGTLFIAFSDAATASLLFPALCCVAVGGILFLVTNMQVGNLFGSHRSTVITLYNGAFDSSSAIFLIIKLLFEGGISLRTSFLFLSACSLIHVIRTFFLMPRRHIPYPLPAGYTYGVHCGKNSKKQEQGATDNRQSDDITEETHFKTEETSASPNKEITFRSCVLSWFFLWHLLWLSVMQLRHYLFIGTLNTQLMRLTKGSPTLVSRYTNAFAITQLCGVLCAPWNGLLIDQQKNKKLTQGETERASDLKACVISLAVTALQCLLFSACASVPFLPLQYLTFILQVLNRSFLYGGNAAFLSVAFPACHFGKLYGLAMALSAIVSLLQYPCFAMVKTVLAGDPKYVNVTLTLVVLLAFIHPAYVCLHCHRQAALGATPKAATTRLP